MYVEKNKSRSTKGEGNMKVEIGMQPIQKVKFSMIKLKTIK